MNIIQLTSLRGEEIFVNLDNVCYIKKPGDGKGSKITFNGMETCLNIKEDPKEIAVEIRTQSS